MLTSTFLDTNVIIENMLNFFRHGCNPWLQPQLAMVSVQHSYVWLERKECYDLLKECPQWLLALDHPTHSISVATNTSKKHSVNIRITPNIKHSSTASNNHNHRNNQILIEHIISGASGCVATLLHDGIMNPAEGKTNCECVNNQINI